MISKTEKQTNEKYFIRIAARLVSLFHVPSLVGSVGNYNVSVKLKYIERRRILFYIFFCKFYLLHSMLVPAAHGYFICLPERRRRMDVQKEAIKMCVSFDYI